MLRGSKLIRAFLIVGFCNGIFVSGLILFAEWRGFNAAGHVSQAILLTLFPAIMQMWEFEGGKASELAMLLICSTLNGCLYGLIGLQFSYGMETWRQRTVRSKG